MVQKMNEDGTVETIVFSVYGIFFNTVLRGQRPEPVELTSAGVITDGAAVSTIPAWCKSVPPSYFIPNFRRYWSTYGTIRLFSSGET